MLCDRTPLLLTHRHREIYLKIVYSFIKDSGKDSVNEDVNKASRGKVKKTTTAHNRL